jgi:prepilin-type N-terminal cleavage/methylation domain-containing protein
MKSSPLPRRPGFTIVELLVAMALIVLIMAVLSQAFVSGLETFSRLKSIGDMQERMRAASVNLRLDLLARHFEYDRKLSDPAQFWALPYGRPVQGFFRIQGARPTSEGVDADGLPSYRTDPNATLPSGYSGLPVLHFGLKTAPDRGVANQRSQFMTCRVLPTAPNLPPLDQEGLLDLQVPGTMNSPWAEVAYFLVPSTDPVSGQQQFAGTLPLFSLHRRQRLCVDPISPPVNSGLYPVVSSQFWGQYPEVSCAPSIRNDLRSPLHFNSEYDLTQPYLRSMMEATGRYSNPAAIGYGPPADPAVTLGLPYNPPENTNVLAGDDLLVVDVISFEIKVLQTQSTVLDFQDINDVRNPISGIQYFPNGWYDTADPTILPQYLPIQAIKVVIRVWDFKSGLTRQITVIQEM